MSNVSDCICVSSLSDGDLDTEKRRCLVVSVASIYSSSVEKRQKNCMQEPDEVRAVSSAAYWHVRREAPQCLDDAARSRGCHMIDGAVWMMIRHAASWPGKDLSPRRLKSNTGLPVETTKLAMASVFTENHRSLPVPSGRDEINTQRRSNKDEINAWSW